MYGKSGEFKDYKLIYNDVYLFFLFRLILTHFNSTTVNKNETMNMKLFK